MKNIINTITRSCNYKPFYLEFEKVVERGENKKLDAVRIYNFFNIQHGEQFAKGITAVIVAADVARRETAAVFRQICKSQKAGYNAIENAAKRKSGCAHFFANVRNFCHYVDKYPQKAFELFDYSHFDGNNLISAAVNAVISNMIIIPTTGGVFSEIETIYSRAQKAVSGEIWGERKYIKNTISDDEKYYNARVEFAAFVRENVVDYDLFETMLLSRLTDKQAETYFYLFVSKHTYEQYCNSKMPLKCSSKASVNKRVVAIRRHAAAVLNEMNSLESKNA